MLFFLSEFFQYNDDFYGDFYGDTFVATNFLISLFLFFPLYDFNLILLASERASQGASLAKAGGVGRTHRPPWLRAWPGTTLALTWFNQEIWPIFLEKLSQSVFFA